MRRHYAKATLVLIVAVVLTIAVTAGVMAALRNPAGGDAREYSAGFSDASGLRTGSDVRLRGVLVGKVSSVGVKRTDTGNEADVAFSVQKTHPITSTTRLAVKYRNLTGERFVEIQPGTSGGGSAVSRVPMSMTTPSFDVTTLFDGLAPVLRTLSPDDVNQLTRNLVALLEGDGAGASETFAAVDRITANLQNRQQVIKVLIDNVSSVASTMNNYSPQVVEFITNFDLLLTKTLENLEEFRRTAQYGPGFVTATNRVLKAMGLSKELDIEKLLTTAIRDPGAAAEALGKLPGIFTGVSALLGTSSSSSCSKGEAKLPESTTVLVGGVEMVVCNR